MSKQQNQRVSSNRATRCGYPLATSAHAFPGIHLPGEHPHSVVGVSPLLIQQYHHNFATANIGTEEHESDYEKDFTGLHTTQKENGAAATSASASASKLSSRQNDCQRCRGGEIDTNDMWCDLCNTRSRTWRSIALLLLLTYGTCSPLSKYIHEII